MYQTNRRKKLDSKGIILYLLLACIACWGLKYTYSAVFPVSANEVETSPIWKWGGSYEINQQGIYILGFSLTLLGAFFIHRANYILILIREKTLLPALFYLVLMSTYPDFLPIKVSALVVLFMVLALYYLFITYHDPKQSGNLFKAFFTLGFGSLFWAHLLWFIPLFWYGMCRLRSFSLRSFVASCLGVIVIYWFVFFFSIWTNNPDLFLHPFQELTQFSLSVLTENQWIDWCRLALLILLVSIASINIVLHEYEDKLRTRDYLWFLIVFMGYSIFFYFIYGSHSDDFLPIAYIPASILMAHFFTVIHSRQSYWLFQSSMLCFIFLYFLQVWNF